MITLFSTPKNFTGIFSHIQLNALRSWRSISPDIQIIIFGGILSPGQIGDQGLSVLP